MAWSAATSGLRVQLRLIHDQLGRRCGTCRSNTDAEPNRPVGRRDHRAAEPGGLCPRSAGPECGQHPAAARTGAAAAAGAGGRYRSKTRTARGGGRSAHSRTRLPHRGQPPHPDPPHPETPVPLRGSGPLARGSARGNRLDRALLPARRLARPGVRAAAARRQRRAAGGGGRRPPRCSGLCGRHGCRHAACHAPAHHRPGAVPAHARAAPVGCGPHPRRAPGR